MSVVEEVRRQFKEKPGIMQGTDKPDYGTRGRHADQGGDQGDDHPVHCCRSCRRSWSIRHQCSSRVKAAAFAALGAMLLGVIVTGLFVAVSMTTGGGAWDNAKKYIRGWLRDQGRRAPRALRPTRPL
jgi:K(+)-stimulated pyrophosphate-energized sodium pump